MKHLIKNQKVFKKRLNISRYQLVKMLSIKKFTGDRSKLKGFLVQVKLQINNKGPGLPTPLEKIAYTGIYLTGKTLK